MTYLVTGCAGFIASEVTRQLSGAGHQVIGIDNVNDAYDPRLKEWRLSTLRDLPGVRVERLDITDRDAMAALFREHRFDAVVNLAARAGVRQSLTDPWVYMATNAVGTLNILDLCRQHDVRTMLLASTSSLYGAFPERPFRETTPTDRPLSPYAASKKAAEAMAASYAHLYGMATPVMRYFTVYGPAGRPDMSVFRFVRNIAEGDPIIVYGDGTQERDFTYVEDIARGTIAGLQVKGHEIINLGGDRPVRLDTLIGIIEKEVGRAVKIDRRPLHPADVQATWADISKARKLLGWEPRVPLEEGVRRTVAWYMANRSWASALHLGD
jgi:nucleoside-diphosphate-sugar epimerase